MAQYYPISHFCSKIVPPTPVHCQALIFFLLFKIKTFCSPFIGQNGAYIHTISDFSGNAINIINANAEVIALTVLKTILLL